MKYAIIMTLPSGAEYVASQLGGKFALRPVRGGRVKDVLAWDTPKEAAEFLNSLKKTVGDEDFAKIMALKPKVAPFQMEN